MNIWENLFNLDSHRESDLQKTAALLHQKFSAVDPFFLKNQLGEFKLFQKGSRKMSQNVMAISELEFQRYLFDYRYTVSTGKSSRTFKQTVLFINSKSLGLPSFYQQPENFFHRLFALMGYDDIDFASHPDYSYTHKFSGEHESIIRHYFSNEVLDLLSNQPAFYMEGMNYYFILYTHKELLPVNRIKGFLQLGQMLFELFKIRGEAKT